LQVVVPAAGSYYVQLFANTPADAQGIFPADTNGFEGRTYVGDAPAQSGSPVTAGKPTVAGTLVAGNTVAVIEIPAGRVPAGHWLTATATLVEGDVAGSTSGFSEAVQRASVPVLAVGSDGPAVWVPHYNYRALSGNVLRLGGLTVTEATRIVTIYSGNPAAAWESVSLDVSNVFPGYSGGFQVTLGDVLPEAAGAGRVLELVVAGTGKVAVYQLTVAGPGSRPVISPVQVAEWTTPAGSRITGLAAGRWTGLFRGHGRPTDRRPGLRGGGQCLWQDCRRAGVRGPGFAERDAERDSEIVLE